MRAIHRLLVWLGIIKVPSYTKHFTAGTSWIDTAQDMTVTVKKRS